MSFRAGPCRAEPCSVVQASRSMHRVVVRWLGVGSGQVGVGRSGSAGVGARGRTLPSKAVAMGAACLRVETRCWVQGEGGGGGAAGEVTMGAGEGGAGIEGKVGTDIFCCRLPRGWLVGPRLARPRACTQSVWSECTVRKAAQTAPEYRHTDPKTWLLAECVITLHGDIAPALRIY